MFPKAYWPPVYYPPSYFPGSGVAPAPPTVGCKPFSQLKIDIQDDLNTQGVFFSATDLNNAVQAAYDLTVALSQCIIRKVTLPFQANLFYYNFQDQINYPAIYVADYMATTAIFSNLTNIWLLDDKVLKDFDRDRIDLENWTGNSIWWAPTNDYKRIALIPYMPSATGTFDLYYYAQAPTVSDVQCPEVPIDFEYLIELYATAHLLEVAQEFGKAQNYLNDFYGIENGEQLYDAGIHALAARTKNLAKSDLLMLA